MTLVWCGYCQADYESFEAWEEHLPCPAHLERSDGRDARIAAGEDVGAPFRSPSYLPPVPSLPPGRLWFAG